jgi:hypothetical protein
MNDSKYQEIILKLKQIGFDLSRIQITKQL